MKTAEPTTDNSIPAAIYESPEDLDHYLADIRYRREQHRRAREKRDYWQAAIQKVAAELAQAQTEGDFEIVDELCRVLAEFERLRATTPALTEAPRPAQTDWTVPPAERLETTPGLISGRIEPPAVLAPAVKEPVAKEPPSPPETVMKAPVPAPSQEAPAPAPKPDESGIRQDETYPSLDSLSGDVVADTGLSAEERQARLRTHEAAVNAIAAKWTVIEEEGLTNKTGGLDRANCARMRALACTLHAIYARAFDEGLEQSLLPRLRTLRDAMGIAREYANDRGVCLPFDDHSWDADRPQLTTEEWEELAGRYERMIPAQAAWEWWEENRQSAPQIVQVTVLNSIAAAQQALYRTLEDFEGRDRLQSELHTALVDAAKQTGYLTSLKTDTSFDDLVSLAADVERTLAAAKLETREFEARKAKDARKQAALADIERFFAEQPNIGSDGARVIADREALFPLLDECMAAGIPPTNVHIRNALVDGGPRLLEGEIKYSRILDAVAAERQRRGLNTKPPAVEIEPDEEPSEAVIDEYRQVVSLFTAEQRILILGGVPRQRVCDELKELLGCADVQWKESKKSDKAVKFQNDIKRANILVLVKNFAGHDMSEKGKEWIKSVGGHFVFLPSGYGVNQIIYQLYKQGGLARVSG